MSFYAPWCGHCRNLQPAYEKAAKNLAGLAKVAAVDCDVESNKAFCGSMGVQGFPTLKIVRPGKKAGRPSVEDYQGPRNAKGIVDAVIEKIPNHVKRIGDKGLEQWLKEGNDTAKAILFSNKGVTSALLKSLAIDFLDGISFAQIRDKETDAVATFGITQYPTLVLLPGGTQDGFVYDGEMKKEPMITFLSQVSPPNPDPAPKKSKSTKSSKSATDKKDRSNSAKDKTAFDKASASHASSEASEAAAGATSIIVEEPDQPTESPDPAAAPADAPKPVTVGELAPPIPTAATTDELQKICLGPKSKTCVLALLPPVAEADAPLPDATTQVLSALADISHKHAQRESHLFPFYAVPEANPVAASLRSKLGLSKDDMEVVAINIRRGWWNRLVAEELAVEQVEDWIDAIRLGEAGKEILPGGIVLEAEEHGTEKEKAEEHDEL
ncbi:MAG: hypothetical protein M1838_005642 [Thelocarpon superellum]|nr:MAG: hypothetical protein M1838_005642 [Thelocarpon superellum]